MGGPPDQYALLGLTGNTTSDLAAINNLANQGFRFVASWQVESGKYGEIGGTFVLMGNYNS